MKIIVKVSSLFILILLSSCFEKDVYPDVPKIEFEDVIFYDGDVDSLVLSFEFEDGDGNIGLDGSEPPFHIFDGITDSTGQFILIGTPTDSLISPFFAIPIEARETVDDIQYFQYPELARFFAAEDLRQPYNCEDYFIIDTDTLYVDRNEFNKNIYIVFEKRIKVDCDPNIDEDCFEKIELPRPDCDAPDFNARIPFFETGAQKGTIKYNIQSQSLRLTFSDDILRIKFWIYDRALNQSNIAYTKEFTLAEITQ